MDEETRQKLADYEESKKALCCARVEADLVAWNGVFEFLDHGRRQDLATAADAFHEKATEVLDGLIASLK